MKLLSRIALPVVLLSSCLHADQTILLAKAKDIKPDANSTLDFANPVVKDSANIMLRDAMNSYHHYYSRACDVKLFDFSLSPVFKQERAIDGSGIVNTYGGFVQAQLNLGDFYFNANTLFGHVNEDFKGADDKEVEFTKNTVKDSLKHTSFDDVNLMLGYDFFFNGDDHIGIYALGGIPVNREDDLAKATLTGDEITFDTTGDKFVTPWMYDVRLGTGNYRIGGGLNAAFTLCDCDDHHLAWLSDTQYTYAFKADVAKINSSSDILRYTPGHTLNFFNALHYAFACHNVELGTVFATTFGGKWNIEHAENSKYPEYKEGVVVESPLKTLNAKNMTVAFKAQPYLAYSYNTTVCDCPLMVGLGLGYEYNKLHSEDCKKSEYPEKTYSEAYPECISKTPNAFQGVTAWGTVALSF